MQLKHRHDWDDRREICKRVVKRTGGVEVAQRDTVGHHHDVLIRGDAAQGLLVCGSATTGEGGDTETHTPHPAHVTLAVCELFEDRDLDRATVLVSSRLGRPSTGRVPGRRSLRSAGRSFRHIKCYLLATRCWLITACILLLAFGCHSAISLPNPISSNTVLLLAADCQCSPVFTTSVSLSAFPPFAVGLLSNAYSLFL
jgi:hypothetical protein